MEFGPELRDFLSMHFVKSPATDLDLPWIFKHNFCEDEGKQYYAWTTNRMLQSCHYWLQANDQVEDGGGGSGDTHTTCHGSGSYSMPHTVLTQ